MAELGTAVAQDATRPQPVGRGASGAARRGSARTWFNYWALLVLPGLAFLAVFYVVPLLGMALRSFTDPGPGNYLTFVENGIYARVLWTTIRTALVTTAVAMLLGYPYAYVMLRCGPKLSAVLGALVLLPFWSSILVRTYAWTVLLQDNGVVNNALKSLGLISESLPLMRNTLGVTIGMTQILLPFLVFPVYAVMRRIDPDVLPAAEGLGARPSRAFARVFFPLSLPGLFSGCLLVFVLSIGFYITPALLGSPSNTMYSVLVADMVNVQLQFGVASAHSIILLAVTLALLWLGTRVVRLGDILDFSPEL